MVQNEEALELCRCILARISGRSDRVELARTKLGVWPRLDLGDGNALQYAFLLPVATARAELHVFPGDTLSQARILFADSTRPDALLRLLADGWQARPSFHFGARQTGLVWTNATAPVDRYVNWCLAYVPRARQLAPHEWERLLDELLSRGFASEGDKDRFYGAFGSRQNATPRPALHFWKRLEADIEDPDLLAREAKAELMRVLHALRQPLV